MINATKQNLFWIHLALWYSLWCFLGWVFLSLFTSTKRIPVEWLELGLGVGAGYCTMVMSIIAMMIAFLRVSPTDTLHPNVNTQRVRRHFFVILSILLCAILGIVDMITHVGLNLYAFAYSIAAFGPSTLCTLWSQTRQNPPPG